MKILLSLLAVGFIGFIVATPYYLGPNDLQGCGDSPDSSIAKCKKADAIIAVSGGDTEARTIKAIELYQQGWADLLIFSGAAQDTSGPSNALTMKRLALEYNVPASAVVIEEFSRTTAENAGNTTEFIKNRDIGDAILVTSAYHQRRAFLEFSSRIGPTVDLRNSPVAHDKHWGPYWWSTARGWWLAGGELAKITAFYIGEIT